MIIRFARLLVLAMSFVSFYALSAEPENKKISFEEFREAALYSFNKDVLKKGIEQGIDLNQKVGISTVFFHMVKIAGTDEESIKLIELALSKGADPNIKGTGGYTPFMLAAGLKNKAFIEPFLKSPKLDFRQLSDGGRTVLFYAYDKDRDILKRLLEANPSKECLDVKDKNDESLLYKVITSSRSNVDLEIIDKLHALGADFSLTSPLGLPPLQYAVYDGKNLAWIDEKVLLKLMDSGASVLAKNSKGEDLLHFLFNFNLNKSTGSNLFKIFTSSKEVKDTTDDEGNNLLLGLFLGQKQLGLTSFADKCQTLIELKSDLNAVNREGLSVLMAASYSGCSDCVIKLIEAKAPLKPEGANDLPLLFYAIKGEINANALKKLIDYGADVNETDKESGTPPLIMALLSSAEDRTIAVLLEKGADVNAADNDGRNALMAMAFLDPDPNIASRLIRAGASLETKDKAGLSAIDYLEKSPLRSNPKYEKYFDGVRKLLTGENK